MTKETAATLLVTITDLTYRVADYKTKDTDRWLSNTTVSSLEPNGSGYISMMDANFTSEEEKTSQKTEHL